MVVYKRVTICYIFVSIGENTFYLTKSIRIPTAIIKMAKARVSKSLERSFSQSAAAHVVTTAPIMTGRTTCHLTNETAAYLVVATSETAMITASEVATADF